MKLDENNPGEPGRQLPPVLLRHRNVLSWVVNGTVIAIAYTLAFLLRFDFVFPFPRVVMRSFLLTLPAALVIHFFTFHIFRLTRGWWRYVGVVDFLNAAKATLTGSAGLAAFVMIVAHRGYPRSIFVLNPILLIGLTISVRLAVRLYRQAASELDTTQRKRLLIIGAGDTGDALLREIRQSSRLNYQVVAFLDDNPAKRGAYINGVPVADRVEAAADVVQRLRIGEIIVATPSASGEEMRQIIAHCRAAKVPFKVMPATWEVLSGNARIDALREVNINDLLRRPPVQLDTAGIDKVLKGKRVLVTGAAGSIGSEICRQVLRFAPASLTCLDHDENALFYLERSLRDTTAGSETTVRYCLADITDETRMEGIIASSRPQVSYHAAAHKHVPMIEANPVEGVRNNVFGTETVAKLAGRFGAETFVLISTDKAVNPSSVMGATKRMAERLIQTLPFETRYTAVRFGNVLGSQGSVVPLLKEQIAAGGPVTVTHPDMRRYFMTIPEAVQLVIQASALGGGDQVFMLDMGDPVKIVDLASDLITLSGRTPGVDIEIVYSGIRPGEKLYEELYLELESAEKTSHPKIMVARHAVFDAKRYGEQLQELRLAVDACDESQVRVLLPVLVPEYKKRGPATNVVPLMPGRSSTSTTGVREPVAG
jgi:FlaA1/EpsC-like NDP-sugar epimerase